VIKQDTDTHQKDATMALQVTTRCRW